MPQTFSTADAPSSEPLPVYTIGHSTRTIPEFVELLRVGRVEVVVDVRSFPRSRTNPQFNLDTLPAELASWQIDHTQIAELGGRRKKSKTVPPEVNGFWTNQSFHNYADYALSDEFRVGLWQLNELSRKRRCAMMCSEAVWWRCHRRFIADYFLHDGRDVFHLMGPSRVDAAKMNPAARADGPSLVYPALDAPTEGWVTEEFPRTTCPPDNFWRRRQLAERSGRDDERHARNEDNGRAEVGCSCDAFISCRR